MSKRAARSASGLAPNYPNKEGGTRFPRRRPTQEDVGKEPTGGAKAESVPRNSEKESEAVPDARINHVRIEIVVSA